MTSVMLPLMTRQSRTRAIAEGRLQDLLARRPRIHTAGTVLRNPTLLTLMTLLRERVSPVPVLLALGLLDTVWRQRQSSVALVPMKLLPLILLIVPAILRQVVVQERMLLLPLMDIMRSTMTPPTVQSAVRAITLPVRLLRAMEPPQLR